MNLLIVDDHPGARRLIRDLVAEAGDTVCECESGERALEALANFAPDWVTLDLMMAGRSGLSVLRTLREVCPRARVAVVSSYDDAELQRAALARGATAYVPKDRMEQLVQLVAAARAAISNQ